MKKRYLYSGYIEIEYKPLISLMKKLFIALKVRDRYASDIEKVIHYNDDNLDIYINEDGHKGFLLSGELKGTFTEANNFINKFTEKLEEIKL